jgi:TolB-like protein
MRRMSLIVFLFCLAIQAMTQPVTMAVLDFQNNSFMEPEKYASLSKGLAEMMITELGRLESMQVVERQKLRSLMDEMKLSQAGVTEEGSVEVGKLIGAKYLVFGSFLVSMDNKIRIDLRIIEVETGLTVKAAEVTGKTKEVLTLLGKLSQKVLRDLNVKLTKKEAQYFESSQPLDMEAVVLYSQGVEFEDKGELKKAGKSFKSALDIEPEFEQAKIHLQRIVDLLQKK